MNEYFWLLCGLWCGIGGSIFARFQLRKSVDSGEISQLEVSTFVRGMAFWIFVPCLVLWILQFSIKGAPDPTYPSWPAPQRYMALAVQYFVWIVLVIWVLFKDGANTLSRFSPGFFSGPELFRTPTAFKFYVVAMVISGSYAAFSSHV